MLAKRMARASLLLALVAGAMSVLLIVVRGPAYVGVVPALAALGTGYSAARQASRFGTKRPFPALAGLVLGGLISAAVVVWFAGLVLLFLLCRPASEC